MAFIGSRTDGVPQAAARVKRSNCCRWTRNYVYLLGLCAHVSVHIWLSILIFLLTFILRRIPKIGKQQNFGYFHPFFPPSVAAPLLFIHYLWRDNFYSLLSHSSRFAFDFWHSKYCPHFGRHNASSAYGYSSSRAGAAFKQSGEQEMKWKCLHFVSVIVMALRSVSWLFQ